MGKIDRNAPYSEAFEAFWQAYPRKTGKGYAWECWQRAQIESRGLVIDTINSVAVHKKSREWQKDGGQFIPHPSTWLNQRRWEDSPGIDIKRDGVFTGEDDPIEF